MPAIPPKRSDRSRITFTAVSRLPVTHDHAVFSLPRANIPRIHGRTHRANAMPTRRDTKSSPKGRLTALFLSAYGNTGSEDIDAPESHSDQNEETEREEDENRGPPLRLPRIHVRHRVSAGHCLVATCCCHFQSPLYNDWTRHRKTLSAIATSLVMTSRVPALANEPLSSSRVEPRVGCHRSRFSRPRRPSNSCM